MPNSSTAARINQGDLSHITTYQAGILQAAAHRQLQRYCDEALEPYGITKMQWLIIGTVLDAGQAGIRLTELSAKLGTTASYITASVNFLEASGYVKRAENSQDSRSKLVLINPDIVDRCHEIEVTLRQALRETIYADIDPVEFRIYMKVLVLLSGVVERK